MRKQFIVRCALECSITVEAGSEEEASTIANDRPPTEWPTQCWSPDEIEEIQS